MGFVYTLEPGRLYKLTRFNVYLDKKNSKVANIKVASCILTKQLIELLWKCHIFEKPQSAATLAYLSTVILSEEYILEIVSYKISMLEL